MVINKNPLPSCLSPFLSFRPLPALNVQVHLYGTLRRFSHPDTPGLWTGEIPEHATIRELMAEIGTTDREVSAASVNGRLCPFDSPIPPDAKIMLVTPVGGG